MKVPLLVVAVLGSISAGYWLGHRSSAGPSALVASNAPSVGRPASLPSFATAAPEREHSAIRSSIRELATRRSSPDRDAEFRLALARAPAPEVVSLLQTLLQLPPNPQREHDLRVAYEIWGRHDPASALAHAARELGGMLRDHATAGIVTGWAARDPRAALAWVSAPPASKYAAAAIEGLSQLDFDHAARVASALPPEQIALRQGAHWAVVESALRVGDFNRARAFTDQISDPGLRLHVAARLADIWGRHDPRRAVEWSVLLPATETRSTIITNLASIWAAQNPREAAEFAAALPPGTSRQDMWTQVVLYWSSNDVVAASQWLDHFDPHPDNDPAMAAIATNGRVVARNPETAVSWAEGIVTEATRLKAIRAIVEQWAARDLGAAQRYLERTTALSTEQRLKLAASLSTRPPSE